MSIFPKTIVPNIIPGIVSWLDCSDLLTITESGNFVSLIKDKSCNGNNAAQITGSEQPSTNITTINGLNAVRLDSDNTRFMDFINTTFTDMTIAIVINRYVSFPGGIIVGGAGNNQVMRYQATSSNLGYDGVDALSYAWGENRQDIPEISIGLWDSSGAPTRTLYGNSLSSVTSGSYDGDISVKYLGNCDGGGIRGGIDLGELLLFDRVLNNDEILAINYYLANKWKIALS